uniref:Putative secreted protein n=1 Tax=Panstrongylus lignarius TaxID=156445 RepID=A0A224Y3U0_9HEMI
MLQINLWRLLKLMNYLLILKEGECMIHLAGLKKLDPGVILNIDSLIRLMRYFPVLGFDFVSPIRTSPFFTSYQLLLELMKIFSCQKVPGLLT